MMSAGNGPRGFPRTELNAASCSANERGVAVVFPMLCGLGGCISATAPILADAQAILGDQIEVHLFSGPKSGGRPHTVVTYQWNGSRYLPRGPSPDFGEFTIHPYEGR